MILLELPGLPPLANVSKSFVWQKMMRVKNAWKTRVGYMLLGKAPKIPWKKVQVVFTRHSSREPDYDGLVHSFKPIRDALVEYGVVIDDKNSCMASVYAWVKAPAKAGKITVEIVPVEV